MTALRKLGTHEPGKWSTMHTGHNLLKVLGYGRLALQSQHATIDKQLHAKQIHMQEAIA